MTRKTSLETLHQKIEAAARESGAGLVGFADMAPLKGMLAGDESFFELPYAVTFAVEIPKEAARASLRKPSEEMRSAYKMCNMKLKAAGERISKILAEEGYQARFVDPAQRVNPEKLLGPISQKAIALAAGMGWIGKNGLLITDEYGARQRMGAVLTDMPVRETVPVESKCGDCTVCVDRCALKILRPCEFEDYPEQREKVIDWVRCGEYEAKLVGDGSVPERACGRCISVCPLSEVDA